MAKPAPDSRTDSMQRGYEVTDAWVRPLVISAVVITATTVAAFFLMLWLFRAFEQEDLRQQPPPARVEDITWKAPAIQLQVHPYRDAAAYREAEHKLLHSYAWSDPQAETARIPIERAMEIALKKGYPERTAS